MACVACMCPVGQCQSFRVVFGLGAQPQVRVCGRDGDLGSAGPCSLQGCTPALGFLSMLEGNTKVHGTVQLAWAVQILCCDLHQRKGGGHCKQIMETCPSQFQKLFEMEDYCRFPAMENP